jgi:hypothetical protein
MVKLDKQQVSVDFIVAVLCITVKCLQRTCLPRKSTEIRVDMSVEAHTVTGFLSPTKQMADLQRI